MSSPLQSASLTSRLVIAGLLIILAGGILVTFLAWAYGQRAAQEAFDRLLLGASNQISASITLSAGDLLVDLPATAFDLLALSRNDRVAYRVALSTGETLTGYENVDLPQNLSGQQFYDGELNGEAARYVAVARHFAERDFSGSTVTVVGHTVRARNALAWDIMQNAWFILLFAGVGMAALALFSIRSALQPLRRVSHHLLGRNPNDLSPIDLVVPRELSAFVAAFDRFASRIDRQMHVMQDLIADSAHQLRTPIAALRATTRNFAEDAATAEEKIAFEKIDRQAIRLGRLTDQLLSRALVIHRADVATLSPLDLRQVAIESVEMMDALIPEGQTIRLDLPENPVVIDGDSLSLAEATRNLISNALDHGKPPFGVSVAETDEGARLSVKDCGAGINARELRERSRRFGSSSNDHIGGLGLSIVRAVVRAHGARIELEKTPANQFQIIVVFPPKSNLLLEKEHA